MTRILFLIRSLEIGGAERQLVELVRHLDHSRFEVMVAIFYDRGQFRNDLKNIEKVSVVSLGKKSRWDVFPFFLRFLGLIRQFRPHVIHGYMDVANIFSLMAGKLTQTKVVLGLRASNVDFSHYDWTRNASYKLAAWLSHYADKIIINSQAGRKYHLEHDFNKNMEVIYNGIDTHRFRPAPESGQALRAEWGIENHEILIGIVGRLDPMKGHPVFIQAASIVASRIPHTRFVCAGDGSISYTKELQNLGKTLGLGNGLLWPGKHNDVPALYNALDLLVSASCYGEGFSNVIGEAMACGIPCVVTDVGDSRFIVGETGKVLPPNDPQALAETLTQLLSEGSEHWHGLGKKARQRIEENFSIPKMVASTETVIDNLVQEKQR